MEINLSRHAEIRMKERNISFDEIRFCILFPSSTAEQNRVCLAKSLRENGHVLIVVYTKQNQTIKVITVISSSKISKYL